MTDFVRHTLETAPKKGRPLLEDSLKGFGRVPSLHAVMADAPALLDGYKHLHALFANETSFDKDEVTVVWQTINVEHECRYCVPAHTAIAKGMKVDDAISEALRNETPLPNAHLEALRTFTLQVVRARGVVSDAEIETFLAAGFTRRQVLEVVLGVAQKVMSNYTNHLAQTPVDAPMQAFAWEKARKGAA